MAEENFSDIGRIEAILRLFEGTGYAPESICRYGASGKNHNVAASRVFLEGTDFDLTYFPLKHLGYKSVISVTGELYAAMAHPRTLSVTLGISAKLDFPQVKEIWSGIVTASREHGYSSLALDLIPSRNGLCIAVSAAGELLSLTEKRRTRAKSMDLVCISDNLGAAFMGMQVLEREKKRFESTKDDSAQPHLSEYRHHVGAYLKPQKNPTTVSQLEEAEIITSHGYLVTRALPVTRIPCHTRAFRCRKETVPRQRSRCQDICRQNTLPWKNVRPGQRNEYRPRLGSPERRG